MMAMTTSSSRRLNAVGLRRHAIFDIRTQATLAILTSLAGSGKKEDPLRAHVEAGLLRAKDACPSSSCLVRSTLIKDTVKWAGLLAYGSCGTETPSRRLAQWSAGSGLFGSVPCRLQRRPRDGFSPSSLFGQSHA
jgi:hypothetical protein